MEHIKDEVTVVVKSYHDVRQVINTLKLPIESPPVTSCIEWHKKELSKLLKQKGFTEEEIKRFVEKLLCEKTSLEEKIKICEDICVMC